MIATQGTTRHRWGAPIRFQYHTERHCEFCALVKITMHPSPCDAWREWKYGNGENFRTDLTPRCDPSGEVAAL